MTTRTLLVTGGNSGIGLAIAQEAAARGARVCIASRNRDKSEAARALILRDRPDADVRVYSLDLASLAGIRAFAGTFLAEHPVLDALVNNAGAFPERQQFTADGFEWQFGANYLGPFLLTHLLLPALSAAEDARIVHMASMMHALGRIDPATFRGRRPYIGVRAYGQSKLGNLLFARALAPRLAARGITSNAMHPGGVASAIYDELPAWQHALLKPFLIGPEPAARLAVDLALAPEHRHTTGQYFSIQTPAWSTPASRNVALQESLYAQSCALAGVEPLPRPA